MSNWHVGYIIKSNQMAAQQQLNLVTVLSKYIQESGKWKKK